MFVWPCGQNPGRCPTAAEGTPRAREARDLGEQSSVAGPVLDLWKVSYAEGVEDRGVSGLVRRGSRRRLCRRAWRFHGLMRTRS
jgi:hypothetical protein